MGSKPRKAEGFPYTSPPLTERIRENYEALWKTFDIRRLERPRSGYICPYCRKAFGRGQFQCGYCEEITDNDFLPECHQDHRLHIYVCESCKAGIFLSRGFENPDPHRPAVPITLLDTEDPSEEERRKQQELIEQLRREIDTLKGQVWTLAEQNNELKQENQSLNLKLQNHEGQDPMVKDVKKALDTIKALRSLPIDGEETETLINMAINQLVNAIASDFKKRGSP